MSEDRKCGGCEKPLSFSGQWSEDCWLCQECWEKGEFGRVEKFYEWLQSELGLTDEQAFTVIYAMQEELRVVDQIYERCDWCGHLIEGESINFDAPEWHHLHYGCLHNKLKYEGVSHLGSVSEVEEYLAAQTASGPGGDKI